MIDQLYLVLSNHYFPRKTGVLCIFCYRSLVFDRSSRHLPDVAYILSSLLQQHSPRWSCTGWYLCICCLLHTYPLWCTRQCSLLDSHIFCDNLHSPCKWFYFLLLARSQCWHRTRPSLEGTPPSCLPSACGAPGCQSGWSTTSYRLPHPGEIKEY